MHIQFRGNQRTQNVRYTTEKPLAVKGTRSNPISVGLKFVHLNLLNKKYSMDQYDNCTITYQTCINADSFTWQVLRCRHASVHVRETMR